MTAAGLHQRSNASGGLGGRHGYRVCGPMKRRVLIRITGAVAATAALAVGWLFFAPAQFGGSTSYAVVVGSSMEPLLHGGDLALIRTNDGYGAGDVVLYDNVELGGKVLHRILRSEGGRYVLQGDNNDFIDDARPTSAQIVGRMWITAPKIGLALDWAREPRHAALLVAFATLLALGGGGGATVARYRRRRAAKPAVALSTTVPARRRSSSRLDSQAAIVPLTVATAIFAVLALVAWTRPPQREETVDAAYVQQGRFDYSAAVKPSAVYADGRVDTGEPVFLQIVDRIRVRFAYELSSALPIEVTGTIRLDVTVSDGRGWSRTLRLAPPSLFSGQKAAVEGDLDLKRVRALTDRVNELTGAASAIYTVTVEPLVHVEGTLAGRTGSDTFGPTLPFDLEPVRLQVVSGAAGGEGLSPFAPRVEGVGQRTVGNNLELGALKLEVQPARIVSLAGLGASLALLLLAAGAALARMRESEPARIAARHGELLLPVAVPPTPEPSRITDLADFDALVRLAVRHDRMVLHAEADGEHTYLVEDAGAWYRYRSGGRRTAALPPLETTPGGAGPLAPGALIPGGSGRRFESRRSRLARIGRRRSPR